MEPKPNSAEEFRYELETWGKIPQDIQRPLLNALRKGLIAFDSTNNLHDVWKAEQGYRDFLEITEEELIRSGVDIEPWLEDRTHPLHMYTPESPTYLLLYAWPRTRLRGFKETLDVLEQALTAQRMESPEAVMDLQT